MRLIKEIYHIPGMQRIAQRLEVVLGAEMAVYLGQVLLPVAMIGISERGAIRDIEGNRGYPDLSHC